MQLRRFSVAVAITASLHLGAAYLAISGAPHRLGNMAQQPLWASILLESAKPAAEAVDEPVAAADFTLPQSLERAATQDSGHATPMLAKVPHPVPRDVIGATATEATAPASLLGPAPSAYVPPPAHPAIAFMPAIQGRMEEAARSELAVRCAMPRSPDDLRTSEQCNDSTRFSSEAN
jgi:hypothetical protein